jgi:hypothetical protein
MNIDIIEKILFGSVIFAVGFLTAILSGFVTSVESPFASYPSTGIDAPSDFIKEEDIRVFDDRIEIKISDATVSSYEPTGSMKPVLDYGSNGIRIKPRSEEEIQIGDIISFRYRGLLVVHRVIDKGLDSDGVYFVTKGDGNDFVDGRIRFSQIEYKTIGLLY